MAQVLNNQIDNDFIVKQFSLAAKLLELHQENEFKIRSYNSAVYKLENVTEELVQLNTTQLATIEGVGKSLAEKINQIIHTGTFADLDELKAKTPSSVIELLGVKGIGPKKVHALWKDYKIDSIKLLLEACEKNILSGLKGFGEKTQESIKQSLLFKEESSSKILYAECEPVVQMLLGEMQKVGLSASISGDFARKNEIIHQLQFIIAAENLTATHKSLNGISILEKNIKTSSPFTWKGHWENIPVEIVLVKPEKVVGELFIHNAAHEHLIYKNGNDKNLMTIALSENFSTEEEIYKKANLPFISAELREGLSEFELAKAGKLQELVELKDLKGILHNHSTYSDGKHTLEQMAVYCKSLGYEYLGISDHSQTAIYANGLLEFKVKQQQLEIDELNKKLAPFKIFKGIESDILNDGRLDYEENVLKSFDFIVASIHSNLKMNEEKATQRLITAIENPYTTMLGHPTGRLLLRREGYPIDHIKIIDACAENGVVIEINANPWRLDLDWKYIDYAQNKGVMLSINPDAHETAGYHDMQYGIYVARKGGLLKSMTFNALNLEEIEKHFTRRKK